MNATIQRFGYPGTLIREYDHWVVLLRPTQVTLGSLVLAARAQATSLPDLPEQAFVELGAIVKDIERVLRRDVEASKINYLMLMMADPHVHYHVFPRYEGARSAAGLTLQDQGWPALPAMGEGLKLDDGQQAALADWLRARW